MILDTKEMFDYVEHILIQNGGLKSKKKHLGFRNRLEHIKRVYGWAERILPGVENCNKDMVLTAAIFHDIGYTNKDNDEHAALGAELFLKYATKHHMDEYFASCVADLIKAHSNKDLLKLADTPKELIVLIEADLMDEEGALGLVFDLLAEGYREPDSYKTVFNEIMIHSVHILDQDYMVTPLAKKFWEEKKELIRYFIDNLKKDLFME